jgi:ASPM-SPD-2-Hydin domain-containing protein/glycosyl hydrolase family 123/immunoglobulin I-set domain protein
MPGRKQRNKIVRQFCFALLLLLSATLNAGCAGFVTGANTTTSPTLNISNVQATSTTTTGSQIVWATNVPANSVVDYGTTASYGFSTPVDAAMVTTHQVALSGLSADTTYYYQVNSTDSQNNRGKSGGHSFKTGGGTGTSPGITTQPVNQTVTAGQTATFTVAATGTAPLSYRWQKNGANIFGATSSSYTTPATTTADSGSTFDVVVTNSAGTATSNAATLTVNPAPVAPSITTQPVSQTVTAGQTASFSVTATGSSPLGYQWSKNGTDISGATSASYTTPATATTDNGAQFTAVVSNSAGSVTSSAAALTVNAATYLLSASQTSLSFGNVNTGSNSNLILTLTNSGNSTVTVSSVSTSGAGFTASGVSAGTILSAGQTATLNMNFAPTAAGSVTGSASIASNATNSPIVISLTGNGVQQTASFAYWVMSSLHRVGNTDAPGTTSSIVLSSARGETVDTQVIVQGPAGGMTNVNLSASALSGPNGATIPASNVTLYREYYITVTGTASYGGGSNPPLGSGTYSEPLIPFNDPETGSPLCGTAAALKACNATISGGQNQPYWIDISVPHGATNTPPGTYSGSATISSDQGNATVPVTLTVWNFGLPEQPTELSLWTLWPPAAGNATTTLAQALMRNKVMSWYDVAANAATDITNFGLNRSGLDGYYFIGIQCNGSYSSIPSTSQINTAAANFPAGLGLDFYVADELNGCTADYTPIKTMGLNAHAANRSVKTMMTLNAPDPNLFNEGDGRSAIDHWVLLDSMQQWPALPFVGGGSDLWSYASCNTGFGNTPAWMVDYPPINERIQAGFLNWTQGAAGILYYRADGWTSGNAIGSWNNVDTTACGGLGRPGDGIFLYPPAPIASTESAPGIRLKAIRDGIQDYEYAQILKNLGQVSLLDSLLQQVATSWTNWSHDPNALENARLQLGQQLHQLAPPGY